MAYKAPARPDGFNSGNLNTLVGSTFVNRITDTANAPLKIGTQRWNTHQLAMKLGVVHTRAARLLTAAAESIGAKSVRDLYHRSSPYTFAGLAGLGETTLYVLWRLFESEGLDPDQWAASGDKDDALVSFHSLKRREQQAETRTKRSAKRQQRTNSRTAYAPPEGVVSTLGT